MAGPALVWSGAGSAPFVDNPLVPHERLVGHRQVTDAHLIGLARHHGAVVATFDQAMAALGGEGVRVVPG